MHRIIGPAMINFVLDTFQAALYFLLWTSAASDGPSATILRQQIIVECIVQLGFFVTELLHQLLFAGHCVRYALRLLILNKFELEAGCSILSLLVHLISNIHIVIQVKRLINVPLQTNIFC